MIYSFAIGLQNYIGEAANFAGKAEDPTGAMTELLDEKTYVLLEYGILVEMGNQIGIMHQFVPMYFSKEDVSAVRVYGDSHELAKLFRSSREQARKDEIARRTGLTIPGAAAGVTGPGRRSAGIMS